MSYYIYLKPIIACLHILMCLWHFWVMKNSYTYTCRRFKLHCLIHVVNKLNQYYDKQILFLSTEFYQYKIWPDLFLLSLINNGFKLNKKLYNCISWFLNTPLVSLETLSMLSARPICSNDSAIRIMKMLEISYPWPAVVFQIIYRQSYACLFSSFCNLHK